MLKRIMVFNGRPVAEGVIFLCGKIALSRYNNPNEIEIYENENGLKKAFPPPVYKIVTEPRV